jgi:hypothetical protein
VRQTSVKPKNQVDAPNRSRRVVLLAHLSLACAVVLLFGVWPLTGADLFMHLAVGRWIWEHGAVPRDDVFSYTSPEEPFIAHSWLAELIFYGVDGFHGLVGFGVLRFALVSMALVFAVRVALIFKAPRSALMLLAPFVLGIMWGRLEFRPYLFTSALLACQLWLTVSVHTGARSRHWLWVLPPVFALWINLHGGWVQGLAMLVVIGGRWWRGGQKAMAGQQGHQ